MEIEKLIERLRQERASLELAFPGVNAIVFDVAADALTTMQDREATLIRERDEMRIPTPAMIAAAWNVIDESRTGVAKLGPGLGVREIWQAMFDEALGTSGLVERSADDFRRPSAPNSPA